MNPMPAFYSFLSNILFMQSQQIRAMIDTSVYEFLYLKHLDSLNKMVDDGKIIAYGCKVVRQELRGISPKVKYKGKSFRKMLLSIYDELTEKHDYPLENIVESLAEQYWQEYDGGIPKRKLMNDFRIVAISSVHNLDVVISEDNNSMKSGPAIRSYLKVNNANRFRTPAFYSIEEVIP